MMLAANGVILAPELLPPPHLERSAGAADVDDLSQIG
jgi:hypothetical protein